MKLFPTQAQSAVILQIASDKNTEVSILITDQNFLLFNFETQEVNSFSTIQELIDEAESLNFDGNMKFLTLREYDDLFVCSK